MFMSEEEGNLRLNNPANVLTRIDRGGAEDAPVGEVGPIIPFVEPDAGSQAEIPSDIEQIIDSEAKQAQHDDPFLQLKMRKIIEGAGGPAGRKRGIRNRTVEENGAVGLTSLLLGTKAAGEMFGVTQPEASLVGRGFTSPQAAARKSVKDELLDEIYANGKQVQSRAFTKLLKSIDLVDDVKLEAVKDPAKLVGIAKNLSGIIKDVTPKEGNTNEGGVHFHIYRPEQNTEADYETLEVGADGSVTAV